MVDPNWSLLGNGPNALSMFQMGNHLGSQLRQRRDEQAQKNALAAYATNPSDQTLAPVIAADPRLGIQLRGQVQAQQAQQQEQRRADLPLLGRLLESSTDEASYQQARATAQEYGIDLSSAPATFDPAWRNQQLMTVKALSSPKAQEALSTAGKIAMDQGLRPGTPEFAARVTEIWQSSEAKPYVVGGETRLYTPRIGGTGAVVGAAAAPAPGTVEDGYRFKGGNPADPNSWEPVEGGAGSGQPGFR